MPKFFLQTKKIVPLLLVIILVAIVPNIAFASFTDDAILAVLKVLHNIITGVFGTLVGISGGILDFAITNVVVGFGDLYQNSGLGFSIDILWSTVRDMFNLTFIFGLVFIGFRMILNSSDSSARKMLGSLVLAALLVNFSLFITKFVIDFSNIAAAQLAGGFLKNGVYEVSSGFVNIMGLSTILSAGNSLSSLNLSPGTMASYVFGSLFTYLIAIFVFAAGGILLIIRFAVLNIYMVLSPLMFLGWVFPGFSSVSREYWQGFMSRAFYAPAYILMLYFAHQILINMKGVVAAGAQGQLAQTYISTTSAGATSSLPFFIMTAIFLVASLVVGQKMGSVGASNTIALGRRMGGGARKMATNATTYIPRRVARATVNYAGEKGTRGLNTLQSGTGWGAKILRTNTADRALRGVATSATGAEFGTGTNRQKNIDYAAKTQSRANQTADEVARKEALKESINILEDNTSSAEKLSAALDNLAKSVQKMSAEEKVNLGVEKLTDQNIAAHLTDAEITSWQKEGKFNNEQITQIREARQSGIIATAVGGSTLASVTPPPVGSPNGTPPTVAKRVAKDKDGNDVVADKRANFAPIINREAKDMPIDIFKKSEMQPYLTPEIIEDLIKNGKLADTTDQTTIRANIQNYLNDPSTPDHMRNRWKRWVDNTTLGAGFGITIDRPASANPSSQRETPLPDLPLT